MKTTTVHYLVVTYTTSAGNMAVFHARTVEVNGSNVRLHNRDDASICITLAWKDVHSILKAVSELPTEPPANPTKEFVTDLVSETAYGSTSMGKHFNKMELQREGFRGNIIWNYGKQAADEEETVIGLIFEGMSVTDYDGVFSLPREARMLLIEAGYNLEAIFYDQSGDEIPV